jgi:O-acetylserine/cysteine efflux transporter
MVPGGDDPASRAAAHDEPVAARDLALLVAINLAWGFNLIASKTGVGEFPPIFFTALRFSVLALCLLPWLRLHPGAMRNLVAAALLTGPAAFALMFIGIARVHDVSTVAIASQLGVPFQTLLSVWLLGESIRWRRKLGIALAFGGVALISFDPLIVRNLPGLSLVVASTFLGSLGVIFIKNLRGVRPLELQAWVAASAAATLLPTSLLVESGQWAAVQHADWRGWGALAYTAIVASLFAHTSWYYLVGRYPVSRLSAVTLLSPLFGILFGVTLMGDPLTTRMIAGSAVALTGVYIVIRRERRLYDTGT